MKYIFETRMEVRDYECDIEGIVNNANYLHYTEHTRHLFLRSLGVSFAKLHEQGIDAVIHSMKLQYKVPLRCDDEFISRLNLKKDGLKYMFYQDIYRASDEQLCFRATVELVCLGRPEIHVLSGHLPRQRRATLFPRHRGTRLSHQRSTRQQPRIRRSLYRLYLMSTSVLREITPFRTELRDGFLWENTLYSP